MLLKNLMEKKQLDFNQPILSVRRYASTVATSEAEGKRKTDNSHPKIPRPPAYKAELKSGPIRNPGNVPFVWEKTPGRPKDESKSKALALERPPIAPKLPPGRILNANQQALDKTSESTAKSQPQTRNLPSSSRKASSLDNNVSKYENSTEGVEETGSSSSEDSDEVYVDARDTLSRTESFFYNCSISGVSGLDGPDVKPSGIFLSDPQTRDFMMGRFLPAAKAMASETPQYAFKKPIVAQEQQRPIQTIVSANKHLPRHQHSSYSIPYHPPDKASEESEDEDNDYGGSDSASVACGFFSRMCMKNSFCLLNPVPGMRMQARSPASSVCRTKVKSSCTSSWSETDNQHARNIMRERKSIGLEIMDLHEAKMELKNESNQNTASAKHYIGKVEESTLSKHLQGNGMSPYHNDISQFVLNEDEGILESPEKSTNLVENGHDPQREGSYNFRELLACDSSKWESASSSPVVEKTLYVDSVHTMKSQSSDSSSSDLKGLIDFKGNDIDTPAKGSEMEETPSVDCFKDINHMSVQDARAKWQHRSLESFDSSFLSSSDRSNHDVPMEPTNCLKRDQDVTQDFSKLTYSEMGVDGKFDLESLRSMKSGDQEGYDGHIQDSLALSGSKVIDDGKICTKSQLSNHRSSHGLNHSQSALPPPLPKSPSDSWLMRTLPNVSSKNSRSSLGMRHYPMVQASKTSPLDLKWETIVKTSNVQHGHLRFSEELLTPIPEV